MEEPYRPFTLKKSAQKRVENSEKIIQQRIKKVVSKRFAKKLTENATPPELILIKALLERDIYFYFQRRMVKNDRFYIVDFLIPCKHMKVIIELDGGQHYTKEGLSNDKIRTDWIKANFNLEIKRFRNHAVYNKLPTVLDWIEKQNPIKYSEVKLKGMLAIHIKMIRTVFPDSGWQFNLNSSIV